MKLPTYYISFSKTFSVASHRRYGHKNTPPFIDLIIITTDSLSSLISFSNYEDTTVDYIIVNSQATNLTSGRGNSIFGTDISPENE